MKQLITILFLFYVSTQVYSQTIYSKEVEEQIKAVENNLAGRLIFDGKPYTILERMDHYNVKGLSIAVVQDYKIVWAKAYGWADEEEMRLVTTSTLFKPGSISKSLNAVGVLKLAQENKLDLYKDINNYLISWKFPYDSLSKGKKITPANLLSHTAGTSVYGGFPGYDLKGKIPTIPQILDGVAPANTPAVRSLFEPGMQFQYSGGGTIISQLIITDLSKQGYETFMFDNVLKPLGMTNSFYSAAPPKKNEIKKYAMGYTKEGAKVDATFKVYPEQAPLGLWTTPTELAKYMVEMQLAYKGKSTKVLNQNMASLQLTPYIDNSATMGAFIGDRNGEKYFFHDAGNEGYRGLYYGSVEGGNGLVVFVNSDDGDIILELLSSVSSVYNWKGFDKPIHVNTAKVPENISQKYLGLYLYDGKIAEVTKENNELYFWTANTKCKMYFTSEADFVNIEFPAEKSFMVDELGNVIGYKRKVDGKEFPPAVKVLQLDTLSINIDELISYGWHLLETKRFDKAIFYLTKAIRRQADNYTAKSYLAHSYLFNNEYDKALILYKEYLSNESENPITLKEWLKWELDFFKKQKFNEELIEKVISELGIG